jgi:hypothetical protein
MENMTLENRIDVVMATVKLSEQRVKALKEKLMEDFCYEFAWVCEDLYNEQYKLAHYKLILEGLQSSHICNTVLDHFKTRFEEFVTKDYNVRENSTGSLFREVSTFKFIATMQLLEFVKKIS